MINHGITPEHTYRKARPRKSGMSPGARTSVTQESNLVDIFTSFRTLPHRPKTSANS